MTSPSDTTPPTVRCVAVIGAECTGKTELCEALAHRLPGLTFTEVLRQFVRRTGRAPTQQEQRLVMAEQRAVEEGLLNRARASGHRWLLADSVPLMTAVYSQVYFQDESLLAEALSHHARYDATLVCADDLPWVADPGQRDGEAFRQAAQRLLLGHVAHHLPDALVVSGQGESRVQLALLGLRGLDFAPR